MAPSGLSVLCSGFKGQTQVPVQFSGPVFGSDFWAQFLVPQSPSQRIHSMHGSCHLNPYKVNDNHMEELYQATPEELKENRRLLQVQGDDSYLTTVAFMDRALKKAQVRTELRIHY